MDNKNNRSKTDLPSVAKLIKSTAVAVILASLILITAVLPGEYGIDPTGIGSILGLTKMGEIKVSLAQDLVAEVVVAKAVKKEGKKVSNAVATTTEAPVLKSEKITVSLTPDQGREVKVKMLKGGKVSYRWTTSNGRANFDVHGDSAKHKINYFNYSKGSSQTSEGVLEAEFDGKHGWFWRNRSGKSMTITLEVEGDFIEMTQEV